MTAHSFGTATRAISALTALALCSAVAWIPWSVASRTAHCVPFYAPITPSLPAFMRPLARLYDRNQAWLQLHYVCNRCPQHAATLRSIAAMLPERARLVVDPNDVPILQTPAAGLPGWVVPDAAVLDLFGLNDWVIARTPISGPPVAFLPEQAFAGVLRQADRDHDERFDRDELTAVLAAIGPSPEARTTTILDAALLLFADDSDSMTMAEAMRIPDFFAKLRFMAREHRPPPGYVEGLDPNVTIVDKTTTVRVRSTPLTPDRLREFEREWRDRRYR
jgi:hypothetical protein